MKRIAARLLKIAEMLPGDKKYKITVNRGTPASRTYETVLSKEELEKVIKTETSSGNKILVSEWDEKRRTWNVILDRGTHVRWR